LASVGGAALSYDIDCKPSATEKQRTRTFLIKIRGRQAEIVKDRLQVVFVAAIVSFFF
jgi:hypothetical protein